MCGIAGVIHPDQEKAREAIQSMNRAQAHRGPDDEGAEFMPVSDGWMGLGHRRLAIIDVSPAGHQPMADPDSGNWITFNGEIYNYREIRRELDGRGQRFRTGTDTEVILKAYAHWGMQCVERLRGIFAFGLWDVARQTLLLARDQLGVKPMYMWQGSGQLVFASEVRAILATGLVPRILDTGGFLSYLAYGSVQEPFTLIEGIRSLPAGHRMEWQRGSLRTERYWKIPSPEAVQPNPSEMLHTELAERLTDAVQSQLVADVPLGAFLSGGIDSTAIAALMQRGADRQVRTFSIVFEESAFDERKFSQLAARRLGTEHSEVLLTGKTVRDSLEGALGSYDQPSMDGLNTWFVSRAARETGLTVALSGVGGDELFGGYGGYYKALAAERYCRAVQTFPRFLRFFMAGLLWRFDTSEALRKAAALLTTTRHPYFLTRRLFLDPQIQRLLNPDTLWGSPWESEALACIENEASGYDPINRASVFELQTYMRSTLLRDTDQMSMAHALEVRVPLIDHKLVEFIFTLPGYCKLETRQPKPLLTRPLKDLLPPACVNRPKMGFELPFKTWLMESLHREIKESFCETQSGDGAWPFDPAGLQGLWVQFMTGKVNWTRVWSIFVLRRWMNRHRVSFS
jgi:asparagine synthase (glutamine-hydrolysing)